MVETEADPKPNQSRLTPPPLFHEVLCKASGKPRRFSVGTESGFALSLINKKLRDETPALPPPAAASYIEAIKEDEEPICFGPSSILVSYGPGWKLQTAIDPLEPGFTGGTRFRDSRRRIDPPADVKGTKDSNTVLRKNAESSISLVYVGKIMFALVLLFIFGAIFMLLLENLPQLILYINSSL